MSVEHYPDIWHPADLAARIGELERLEDNWDSYGAKPMAPVTRSLLPLLIDAVHEAGLPRPYLIPVADGGVQLEWDRADLDAELEIPAHGDPPVISLLIQLAATELGVQLIRALTALATVRAMGQPTSQFMRPRIVLP